MGSEMCIRDSNVGEVGCVCLKVLSQVDATTLTIVVNLRSYLWTVKLSAFGRRISLSFGRRIGVVVNGLTHLLKHCKKPFLE